jgi:hypothetical protein
LKIIDDVEPDAETIQHECLDDYPPVTRFHAAINDAKDIEEVRHLWQACKQELDETFEMYLRDCKNEMPAKQKGQGN